MCEIDKEQYADCRHCMYGFAYAVWSKNNETTFLITHCLTGKVSVHLRVKLSRVVHESISCKRTPRWERLSESLSDWIANVGFQRCVHLQEMLSKVTRGRFTFEWTRTCNSDKNKWIITIYVSYWRNTHVLIDFIDIKQFLNKCLVKQRCCITT